MVSLIKIEPNELDVSIIINVRITKSALHLNFFTHEMIILSVHMVSGSFKYDGKNFPEYSRNHYLHIYAGILALREVVPSTYFIDQKGIHPSAINCN